MFANSLRRNGQSASTFWARLDPTRFLRRIYDPKTAQINEWNNAVKQPLTLGSDMVALISFEMIVQCCTQNSRQTTQAQMYWFYWIEKERKLPEWVLDVWTLYLDSVFLIMISFFFHIPDTAPSFIWATDARSWSACRGTNCCTGTACVRPSPSTDSVSHSFIHSFILSFLASFSFALAKRWWNPMAISSSPSCWLQLNCSQLLKGNSYFFVVAMSQFVAMC